MNNMVVGLILEDVSMCLKDDVGMNHMVIRLNIGRY